MEEIGKALYGLSFQFIENPESSHKSMKDIFPN